jgi:glyoxylase-like metal-dependent hydrolase (beta-lactamase superfamily II)
MLNYKTKSIAPGTWAIEEKSPVSQGLCYLLCGTAQALLIDTGFGFPGLKSAVESLTDLPVTVVNTHGHVDHIGGNHFFSNIWLHADDRETFAMHSNMAYTSSLMPGLAFVLKTPLRRFLTQVLTVPPGGEYHYFTDGQTFDLGGRTVVCIHTPGHTPGSCVFLDKKQRLLFSGDTVCAWGVLLEFRECCPPEVFLESMERLLAIQESFGTIWPGHHAFPIDKGYLAEYREGAQEIVNGTAQFIRKGKRIFAKHGRILIALPPDYPKGA